MTNEELEARGDRLESAVRYAIGWLQAGRAAVDLPLIDRLKLVLKEEERVRLSKRNN
jgi:hypothetical protein